jgi:hypothetical protein
MSVGEETTVNTLHEDGAILMTNGYWYVSEDLELVVSEPVVEVLTIEDFEVGDEVRIVALDQSVAEFGNCHPTQVGDIFCVDDIDPDDDSVYDGNSSCWFFISELEKVEHEGENVDDSDYDPHGLAYIDPFTEVEKEPEINFLLTRDSITLMIAGDTEVATVDHQNFEAIRQHVLDGEYDEAMSLMNISIGIQNWGQGSLQIQDGKILYVGMELTGNLVDRIIEQMMAGDASFERFAKFLSLTMEQESFKTRSRLMDFAAHDKLDIDENGYVVAFKNVRSDYFDKHSHTFRNMVGDAPSMRRSDVDDNHDHQCSAGLHVCSPTYLKGFWGTSGRTMRVVVDPRDFVAIPYDYKDSKARVCKYTVVEDVTDNISDYF